MFTRLALACTSVLLSSAALGAETMFRHDPAHTGVYADAGPSVFKGVKWKCQTGSWVISSPVFADGSVYVGSDDGKLYAIDATNGNVRWTFQTGAPVRSTAAVAGDSIYFSSFDGVFYALNTKGELRWKFSTQGERKFEARGLHGQQPSQQTIPDFWDFYLSSPVVGGKTVYFGSGDHRVYALDTVSGGIRWSFETSEVVHASPALVDGVLYVGGWDTYLHALDAETGKEHWRFKTGDDPKDHNQTGIQSSPAIRNGVVYFGCRDGSLYAVDAKTGEQRWKFVTKPTWIIASPAVTDDTVYFGSSDPAKFYAVDVKTGQAKFVLDAEVFVFSSAAVTKDRAYFGSFGGTLYAVDLATAKYAWTFQTDARKENKYGFINAAGLPDFGAIGVRTPFYEEFDRAIDKFLAIGAFIASPALHDDVLYIGSTDGYVYAIE
jgi:outer membrane protein assembly factor BamB